MKKTYSIFLSLITLSLLSNHASATTGVTVHLTGGTTAAPKDSGTTNSQVSGSPSTSSSFKDSDKSAPIFGADITVQSPVLIGVAFAYEQNKYKFSDGTAADQETAFYVIPRLEMSILMLDLWVGCGIGRMTTKFGSSGITKDGVTYGSISPSTKAAISPRAGVDFNLGRFSVGLQVAYTSTKGDATFTGSGGGTNFTGNTSFDRTWLSTSARIGISLF